jgi:hypothetical protein
MAPRHSNRDTDDDAPWLAEAARAPRTTVSRRSFFWTIFVVLALATIAAAGLAVLMAKKDGGSTQGYMNAEQAPVITAEPGAYKVVPADPSGMKIDGLDGAMYTAGEGIDQGGNIDPSLAAEVPLPRPGAAPAEGPPRDLMPKSLGEALAPALATPAAPLRTPPSPVTSPVTSPAPAVALAAKPANPKPVALGPVAPASVTPGSVKPGPATLAKPTPPLPASPPIMAKPAPKPGTVQLGAFSSPEKADAAWTTIAGKYGLSGKRIVTVDSNGKTLYRLRAASADTAATCAKIKAAGDACAAVE